MRKSEREIQNCLGEFAKINVISTRAQRLSIAKSVGLTEAGLKNYLIDGKIARLQVAYNIIEDWEKIYSTPKP